MGAPSLFTAQEMADIEAAVARAEGSTSGEIVPAVVARSDDYHAAVWKGATLGALGGQLLAGAIYLESGLWGVSWFWLILPAFLGGAAGFAATALVPWLRRLLISPDEMDHNVRRRALQAFVDHEVFTTRDRTGVLLFLSLYERRVVVLGDTGINAKVRSEEWDGIVAGVVAGIKAGTPGRAMVEAIGRCGELLSRDGLARRADDTNELPDALQVERE
jgi:putative membrane protein